VNLGWQARDAEQAIAVIEPEMMAGPAAGSSGGAAANGVVGAGLGGNGSAGASGAAGTPEAASPAGEAVAAMEVDVAVALRAALRVLGRK
jgi:hypothetical protein